ncbi:uncharacterized protein VTP21DRAFT_3496 [Calcarisporiella thermophila]|uniref:uncharacterized protein n=1 Tax=Calcarisporiella thermophila TaxID=911321 RepID=UPI003744065D
MEERVLNEIVQAINVIYDPTTSSNARKSAYEFCERLKSDPGCLIYAQNLAHKSSLQPDTVRHFALGLLEDTVRIQWNSPSFDQHARDNLRNIISLLALEGTKDILEEKQYIKEKLAKLFSEVAKREWPSSWESMDIQLQEMAAKGPTTQELSLIVYRLLAEDIFLYDSAISDSRKKDLQRAMITAVVSAKVLESEYPEGVKISGESELTLMRGVPGNEGWLARWTSMLQSYCNILENNNSVAEKLAIAILKTLAAHLSWIIPKSIVEVGILQILLQLLLSPSLAIRKGASECLVILFSRNFYKDDDRASVFEPLLKGNGLDYIFKALALLQSTEDMLEEDAYEIMKLLVQAIVYFGVDQLCTKKITSQMPEQFPKYLELLYTISRHNSVFVSLQASIFWLTAFKHEQIAPNLFNFIPTIFDLCGEVLERFYRPAEESPQMTYALMDYDSTEEARDEFNKIKKRIVELIKQMSQVMVRC